MRWCVELLPAVKVCPHSHAILGVVSYCCYCQLLNTIIDCIWLAVYVPLLPFCPPCFLSSWPYCKHGHQIEEAFIVLTYMIALMLILTKFLSSCMLPTLQHVWFLFVIRCSNFSLSALINWKVTCEHRNGIPSSSIGPFSCKFTFARFNCMVFSIHHL